MYKVISHAIDTRCVVLTKKHIYTDHDMYAPICHTEEHVLLQPLSPACRCLYSYC